MKYTLITLIVFVCMSGTTDDCKDIETEYDKFKGTTSYYSPSKYYVSFSKHLTGKDTFYFVRLQTLGATLNLAEKGVIILLKNGERLEFPDEDVEYSEIVDYGGSYYYRYKSFVSLSKSDVEKLCSSEIEAFQLYIYDGEVKGKHQEQFRNYINCLVKK